MRYTEPKEINQIIRHLFLFAPAGYDPKHAEYYLENADENNHPVHLLVEFRRGRVSATLSVEYQRDYGRNEAGEPYYERTRCVEVNFPCYGGISSGEALAAAKLIEEVAAFAGLLEANLSSTICWQKEKSE